MNSDLSERMQQQVALERQMVAVSQGASLDAWFRDSAGNQAMDNPAAKRIQQEWLPILALAFEAALGASGNRTPAVSKVRGMEPLALAYVTLRGALALTERAASFTAVASRLGSVVEREMALLRDDELAAKVEKKTKGKSGYVRDSLAKRIVDNAPSFKEWSDQSRIEVGAWMIGMLEENLGILEREVRTLKNRKEAYLVVHPDIVAEMDSLVEHIALNEVTHWPMIVPPRRWEGLNTGPYLTDAGNHLVSFIRGLRSDVAQHIEEDADLELVYDAVNAIQETAWAINEDVLGAIEQGLARGVDMPRFDSPGALQKPVEGAEGWQWGRYYKEVEAVRSNRLLSFATLAGARRFSAYDRLYFPHNLDSRGRAYPIPTSLSPQGNDLAQGLLTFANARPLGDTGERWLAIYGANLYGVDKVSFDDRELWTYLHTDAIVDVASDPLSDASMAFWTKADKPYQFLAFCHEWAAVMQGATVTRLPVKMDATCSGIQHLSAIARDPATGRAVNLLGGDVPNDVYGDVAEALRARLVEINETSDDELAQMWSARWMAYGIDRKTTKRATMTLPYGSTQFSARTYVRDDLDERINQKGNKEDTFDGDLGGAAVWLTPHLWASIEETVPGARETMDWLQGIAVSAARVDSHVEWTTPDGFLVVQHYREPVVEPKKVHYLGKRINISIATAGTQLDGRRQRNGMAPNFVHSMDAAALRDYVRLAQAHGIKDHSLIHDSFGTHAGDVELMQQLIRRSFVDMYHDADVTVPLVDWLRHGGAEVQGPVGDRGLDIRQVLTSKYFFS